MAVQPKIGLALGAGAARGLAHLGVLRVLEKYSIPISLITGCSIGALVGSLYACGLGADFLIKFAGELQARSWIDLCMPRTGLISGKKVQGLLKLLTRDRSFEDLPLPFAALATDIERGEAVVLRKGKLAPAVRASISIPVVFKPVSLGGRLLVDGGVVDQVPVDLAREMGAQYVIAVDVSANDTYQPVKNIFDIMFQTLEIMGKRNLRPGLEAADVLVQPEVGHISLAHFHRVEELVAQGERAAEAVAGKLKALLAG